MNHFDYFVIGVIVGIVGYELYMRWQEGAFDKDDDDDIHFQSGGTV